MDVNPLIPTQSLKFAKASEANMLTTSFTLEITLFFENNILILTSLYNCLIFTKLLIVKGKAFFFILFINYIQK